MRKCVVCNANLEDWERVCGHCGFEDEWLGVSFLSQRQYQNWMDSVVTPYHEQWMRKIREEQEEKERLQRIQYENICRDSSFFGTFGLGFEAYVKQDGSVEFIGENKNLSMETSGWRDIFALAAGNFHILGLKKDGTVAAAGKNHLKQCNVRGWKNIVQIAAGGDCSAALDSEGRVFVCGDQEYGLFEAEEWKNIQKISMSDKHLLGLTRDGKVLAVGCNDDGQCRVSGWSEIVDIAAGGWHSAAVKSDGGVVAAGSDIDGECEVKHWREIQRIQAGAGSSVGINKQGDIVTTSGARLDGWRLPFHVNEGKLTENLSAATPVQVILGNDENHFAIAVWVPHPTDGQYLQIHRRNGIGDTKDTYQRISEQ